MSRSVVRAIVVAAVAGLALQGAAAQTRIRPPLAQLWLHAATHVDSEQQGGLTERRGGAASLLGAASRSVLRDPKAPAARAPESRILDALLIAPGLTPETRVAYRVPAALQGGELLMLAAPSGVEPPAGAAAALPSGVVRHYWGCAEAPQSGQPKLLDPAGMPAASFDLALRGRRAADRAEAQAPATVVWSGVLGPGAALPGEHRVGAAGAPTLSFRLDRKHDFMSALRLSVAPERSGALRIRWQPIAGARALFLQAQGPGRLPGETVVWSSSLLPEPGFGLFGYLSNLAADRWLAEGVLLPASLQRCAVPAGIFAAGGTVRVAMIAYGNELELIQPARPRDPALTWEQEWSLHLRLKSTAEVLVSAAGEGEAAPSEAGAPARRPFETLRGLTPR